MLLFEKFAVGLPLHDRDKLWEWMQKVERLLDNFATTPPLMKTEGRLWLNMTDIIQQAQQQNILFALITDVTRLPEFPFAAYSWTQQIPVADGLGGMFWQDGTLSGGDPLSGVAAPVVTINGNTTAGSPVITNAQPTDLTVGQMLLSTQPPGIFPTLAEVLDIDPVGMTVTLDSPAAADSVAGFFTFGGQGPAFEMNGNAEVPIGTVVLLTPGAIDDTLGQTYEFDSRDSPITAKITSGTNPYAWTEQTAQTGGTWTAADDGRTGTTTEQPAYERNANATVAAGTQVLLWRGFQNATDPPGQEWIFDSPASSSGGADHSCRLVLESTSIASGGTATISWTDTAPPVAPGYDTDNYHSPSSNPTRITFSSAVAGKHIVYFACNLGGQSGAPSIGAAPKVDINRNGASIGTAAATVYKSGSSFTFLITIAFEYNFSANDYIEAVITNGSNSTLSVGTPQFGVRKSDKAG